MTFGILVSVLIVFQPPEAKIQVHRVLIRREKKTKPTDWVVTSHSLFCNRVAFPKTPMNLFFPTLWGLNEQYNGCWGEIYEGSGGDAAQVGAYGECNQPGRPHTGCCSTCLCCPRATNITCVGLTLCTTVEGIGTRGSRGKSVIWKCLQKRLSFWVYWGNNKTFWKEGASWSDSFFLGRMKTKTPTRKKVDVCTHAHQRPSTPCMVSTAQGQKGQSHTLMIKTHNKTWSHETEIASWRHTTN